MGRTWEVNPLEKQFHHKFTGMFMQAAFELILNRPQAQDLPSLKRLLSSRMGFEIHEVDALLEHASSVIMRASSPETLEPFRRDLSEAGAKVLIVRASQANPVKTTVDFLSFHNNYISSLSRVLAALDPEEVGDLAASIDAIRSRQAKVIIIGNGGSAANASHLANDLNKRHSPDLKRAIKAISLTDNSAWMTAIANDCGYEQVFVQQLQSVLSPGDLLIAISSSGNSPNILKAVEFANSLGSLTYGIVGFGGGRLLELANRSVNIPTDVGQYGYMEDATLAIGHLVCTYLAEKDRTEQS